MENGTNKIRSGLCVSEHDGGLTIFDPDTGDLFACNQTGARIWSGLSSGLSLEEISNEIAEVYGVSSATATADACAFVSELGSRGWLARRPS